MRHDIVLYHFTSDLHLMGCRLDGLTKGVIPIQILQVGVKFISNAQWLTRNPDFDQAWDRWSTLPYDRTANRLTLCIPKDFTENLRCWKEIGPKLAAETFKWLSLIGDPKNWFIYLGKIPPEWIVETIKNPAPQRRQYGTQR